MTSLMSTGKEDDGAEALAAAMKALSSIYEKDGAKPVSNSYTMGCPPIRGDNPRA